MAICILTSLTDNGCTISMYRGNPRVLDTALEVAEKARSGEVFIFYQRYEKKFLGLIPQKSSRIYHFINGEIASQVKYRYSDKQYGNPIAEEDRQHYFLYFGHEIPNAGETNYHRTLREIEVNTTSFADGIRQFSRQMSRSLIWWYSLPATTGHRLWQSY